MQVQTKSIDTYPKETPCNLEIALKAIGGKWKLVVLWYLSKGTLRFGELHKRIPLVTQKMLSQTLRELEQDKLISRKVYTVIPPKVEYSITPQGRDLHKALRELDLWGKKYKK